MPYDTGIMGHPIGEDYGVDIPTPEEVIAERLKTEQAARQITMNGMRIDLLEKIANREPFPISVSSPFRGVGFDLAGEFREKGWKAWYVEAPHHVPAIEGMPFRDFDSEHAGWVYVTSQRIEFTYKSDNGEW